MNLRDCLACGAATDDRLERVDEDGKDDDLVVAHCGGAGRRPAGRYRGSMDGAVP